MLIDMVWNVAQLNPEKGRLTIMAPSSEDGFFSPAQSISIYGKEHLISLRDALLTAYPIQKQPDQQTESMKAVAIAAEKLCAHIGCEGSVQSDSPCVSALMDALHEWRPL